MFIENDSFAVTLDEATGALSSLFIKKTDSELIGEKRLLANFKICLPLEDYLCNYIDGMAHEPTAVEKTDVGAEVRFSGMHSARGRKSPAETGENRGRGNRSRGDVGRYAGAHRRHRFPRAQPSGYESTGRGGRQYHRASAKIPVEIHTPPGETGETVRTL